MCVSDEKVRFQVYTGELVNSFICIRNMWCGYLLVYADV